MGEPNKFDNRNLQGKKVNQSMAGITERSKFARSIEQIQRVFNSKSTHLDCSTCLLRYFDKMTSAFCKERNRIKRMNEERFKANIVSREYARSSKFTERSFNNSRTVNSPYSLNHWFKQQSLIQNVPCKELNVHISQYWINSKQRAVHSNSNQFREILPLFNLYSGFSFFL